MERWGERDDSGREEVGRQDKDGRKRKGSDKWRKKKSASAKNASLQKKHKPEDL